MINPNRIHRVKGTIFEIESDTMSKGQYIYIKLPDGVKYEGFSGRNKKDLSIGDQVTAGIRFSIMAEQYLIRETVKHRKSK